MTDLWRQHNFMAIIRPKNGYYGPSSRPEDNTFYKCTEENMYQYSGHIYVIYDRTGGNRFYIGSTFQSQKNRKEWHFDECFDKLANSKLYIWMRGRCSSRAEAKEKIVLLYIHHVHFHKNESKATKEKVLKDVETRFINRFYDVRRSLNTNGLDPENRAKLNKTELVRTTLEQVLEAKTLEEAKELVTNLLTDL